MSSNNPGSSARGTAPITIEAKSLEQALVKAAPKVSRARVNLAKRLWQRRVTLARHALWSASLPARQVSGPRLQVSRKPSAELTRRLLPLASVRSHPSTARGGIGGRPGVVVVVGVGVIVAVGVVV